MFQTATKWLPDTENLRNTAFLCGTRDPLKDAKEFLLWLSVLRTQHSVCEDVGSIPGLDQRDKYLVLLWLWCRPAAVVPIQALAWELPYVTAAALERKEGRTEGRKEGKIIIMKSQSYLRSNENLTNYSI